MTSSFYVLKYINIIKKLFIHKLLMDITKEFMYLNNGMNNPEEE